MSKHRYSEVLQSRFEAHFRATDLVAPMVVTVRSSVEEFQALAMRFAAKVLLPGTGWVAFRQLMDLVGLIVGLLGRDFCQGDPWPFFVCVCYLNLKMWSPECL